LVTRFSIGVFLRDRFTKEEIGAIVALLLLSFFIGMALAFFFTVSIAAFLVSCSGKALPWAYLFSGALSYTIWVAYRRLSIKFSFSSSLIIMMVFLFISLGLLTVANFSYSSTWLSFLLLAWVSPFLFIKNVCFWGIASRLFNISQGKKVFGIISSGEVLSNVIGFLFIPFLLGLLNLTGLLVISVLAVAICVAIVVFLTRKYNDKFHRNTGDSSTATSYIPASPGDNFFMLMVISSSLPVFVFYFIDYMFFSVAGDQFGDAGSLASFMGYFLATVSVLELILKSVVFNRMVTVYGLKTGLLSLYAALIISTVLAILVGAWGDGPSVFFSAIALSKLLERSLCNGMHAPSTQILYQPLPASKRAIFQGNAEGMAQAIGNVFAGALLLLLSMLHVSDLVLFNAILLVILIVGIFATGPLYKAYTRKLKEALTLKQQVLPVRKIMSVLDIFNRGSHSNNETIAVISSALRAELESLSAVEHEALLSGQIISASGDVSARLRLESMFFNATYSVRLAMLDLYTKNNTKVLQEMLLDKLDHHDRETQFAVIRTLYAGQYQADDSDSQVIRNKIGNTVKMISWLSACIWDLDTDDRHDYARSTLLRSVRAERREYFDALYMLLSFVYGYSTVQLIKTNLIDRGDTESRIYALELVANTFEKDMVSLLEPWIDNTSPDKGINRMALRYPQQKLSVIQRAIAILYQDYSAVTLWTKAGALLVLGDFYHEGEAYSDIVACLFHKEKLICELAYTILKRNAAREASEEFILRNKILSLVTRAVDTTIYEKVLVLNEIAPFHTSTEHKLASLASRLTFRMVPGGTRINCQDQVVIVVSGTVEFFGRIGSVCCAQSGFIFIKGIHPFADADHGVAVEDSAILLGDKGSVLGYFFDDPKLSKSLLKYASERQRKHV